MVPDFLYQYFKDPQLTPLAAGGTQAKLYALRADGERYVLKVQPLSKAEDSLEKEQRVYAWLSGKVPVPEVKFLVSNDAVAYLCMRELPGNTLEGYVGIWPDDQLVSRYALALKQLHAIPLDTTVPHWPLASRLRMAQVLLQEGAIDEDDIDPSFKHLSLPELFNEMLQQLPETLDEVFIHGDYCFDNLLFNVEAISGFIDMGRGGRADRYQDLAIAARSIREAFDEQMVESFFKAYGLTNPDEGKLRFYTMLDEFF